MPTNGTALTANNSILLFDELLKLITNIHSKIVFFGPFPGSNTDPVITDQLVNKVNGTHAVTVLFMFKY